MHQSTVTQNENLFGNDIVKSRRQIIEKSAATRLSSTHAAADASYHVRPHLRSFINRKQNENLIEAKTDCQVKFCILLMFRTAVLAYSEWRLIFRNLDCFQCHQFCALLTSNCLHNVPRDGDI